MHKKDNKAISEIVSYVLLIIIAVSLSGIVYTWIKLQVPKDKFECPESVSIIIKDYSCHIVSQKHQIEITFENKGYFDIDGVNVKSSNNSGKEPTYILKSLSASGPSGDTSFEYFNPALSPGIDKNSTFDYSGISTNNPLIQKIQVIPWIDSTKVGSKKKEILLCSNSKLVMDVSGCN